MSFSFLSPVSLPVRAHAAPRFATAGLALCAVAAVVACAPAARAADGSYSFSNPKPAESLRDFSTDRPDKTESPFTVDAGHYQMEMDVVTYTRDRVKTAGGTITTTAYGVAPVNLKVGLADNFDLQLVIDTYSHQRVSDTAARTVDTAAGFGDMTLRAKLNLWGNDGGPTAFGLMPFIKIPTAKSALGNGKVEGGLIAPLAIDLGAGFGLGLMTEVDVNLNGTGSGYHAELVNSITLGHEFSDFVGGYVEFFTSRSLEAGARWVNSADVGLTFALAKNVQLDAGVNFGVTQAADDINPFLGISFRW